MAIAKGDRKVSHVYPKQLLWGGEETEVEEKEEEQGRGQGLVFFFF